MSRTISLALLLAALCFSLALSAAPAAQTAGTGKATVRWAYYVPDDPASLASLRLRTGALDYVGLHWASMREDGSVELKPNAEALRVTRSIGARPILSVTAGSGGAQAAHVFLASPASRTAAVNSLVNALGDYDGISIDFEGLYAEDRDSLTALMAELATRLRPAGKLVTMALSARTSDAATGWAAAHDYAALAPHADLFILMAYGYRTSQSSVPGSAAPMSWVEASTAYAVSRIPAQKLFLGVPLYGYDWDTTAGPPAKALRYPETAALAAQHGAQIQRDSQGTAHFGYSRDGHAHDVWFEDLTTLQPRLALAERLGLAGVAAWRLGHEDPEVWDPPSTPPPGSGKGADPADQGQAGTTWYFAEGSTAQPFQTWILLQNPGAAPAAASITFMLESGETVTHNVTVGATSRQSIFANQIVRDAAFSTRVEADRPILAERAMYRFPENAATGVTGAAATARTWFFAAGMSPSRSAPADGWLLLQNPNGYPVTAAVTFFAADGQTATIQRYLPPTSRQSLFVNQLFPARGYGIRVEASGEIIAERSVFIGATAQPGDEPQGAYTTQGATRLGTVWALPEGSTSPPFTERISVLNSNASGMEARFEFMLEGGQTASYTATVPAQTIFDLEIETVVRSATASARVVTSLPSAVERTMFWTKEGKIGAHDTMGIRLE